MAEAASESIKAEMKSYVWLQTSDGFTQQVEEEIAMFCPFICHERHSGMGSSKSRPISIPPRIKTAVLSLVFDYCGFHSVPGHSEKECKAFDAKFVRMDTKSLCDVTSAARSLQLMPLVHLTSRALSQVIKGKTSEEIREIFHLPDDLTEEEKLEPLENKAGDPRIRLLNKLYARKRNELKERQKKNVDIEKERMDDRSVDDLLSFINGEKEDSKGVTTSKNKKKNRRRNDQQKIAHPLCTGASSNTIDNDKKEANRRHSTCQNDAVHGHSLHILGQSPRPQDTGDDSFAPRDEFNDVDIDDEIDPAIKEKIIREVGDFATKLNSDWLERTQKILLLGQERRQIRLATAAIVPSGDLQDLIGITADT